MLQQCRFADNPVLNQKSCWLLLHLPDFSTISSAKSAHMHTWDQKASWIDHPHLVIKYCSKNWGGQMCNIEVQISENTCNTLLQMQITRGIYNTPTTTCSLPTIILSSTIGNTSFMLLLPCFFFQTGIALNIAWGTESERPATHHKTIYRPPENRWRAENPNYELS